MNYFADCFFTEQMLLQFGFAGFLLLTCCYFLIVLVFKRKPGAQVYKQQPVVKSAEQWVFENQLAALEIRKEERTRIAADLHDELGSQVCAIHMTVETAVARGRPPSAADIEKITSLSSGLLVSMETLTWTLVSGDDTIENMVGYIRTYAAGLFENTGIACLFDVALSNPHRRINGNQKRHIFLAIKECLTNITKHAAASKVQLSIVCNESLRIIISDNGRGIDQFQTQQGNGMANMKKRITGIGGEIWVDGTNGTTITFCVKE